MKSIINIKNTRALAVISVLGACLVWGSTFFLIKDLLNQISVFDFLTIRYFLCAVIALVTTFPRWKQLPWRSGIGLGIIYALGQLCQTAGLLGTTAAISGFITALYVVFTPLAMWLIFRTKISRPTFFAVGFAFLGLAILSSPDFSQNFNLRGEFLTLCGALSFTAHVVCTSRWAKPGKALDLAAVQMIVIGTIFSSRAIFTGVKIPSEPEIWTNILYLAIFAGFFALIWQSYGQARLSATHSAIIMATEPIFAASFAIGMGQEELTLKLLIGGTAITLGLVLAEIKNSK